MKRKLKGTREGENILAGRRKNELVGVRFRSPRLGMPARQCPRHGRRPHRRPMETPSGNPSFPQLSVWFSRNK